MIVNNELGCNEGNGIIIKTCPSLTEPQLYQWKICLDSKWTKSNSETVLGFLCNIVFLFISEHNELLPSLQKCSGFLDFIENQSKSMSN